MGKSFNDDVFNNNFNIDSINGLNISKEAIEENKKTTNPNIEIGNINIKEMKDKIKKQEKEQKTTKNKQNEIDELLKEQERLKEQLEEYKKQDKQEKPTEPKITYIKKTMIFKEEYLDIIEGLAKINDMFTKDVLNQLLERAISQLDVKVKEKALKVGKLPKEKKTTKNIY